MQKFIIKVYLTAFLIIGFLPAGVSAQGKIIGEIINVSYTHKIAFTDIGNEALAADDIVEVYQDNKLVTYLKVTEASEALSKLGPTRVETFFTDFAKVQVGQTIRKVPKAFPKKVVVQSQSVLKQSIKVDEKKAEEIIKATKAAAPKKVIARTQPPEVLEFLPQQVDQRSDLTGQLDNMIKQNKRLITHLNQLVEENENLDKQVLNEQRQNQSHQDMIKELKGQMNRLRDKLTQMADYIDKNIEDNE